MTQDPILEEVKSLLGEILVLEAEVETETDEHGKIYDAAEYARRALRLIKQLP